MNKDERINHKEEHLEEVNDSETNENSSNENTIDANNISKEKKKKTNNFFIEWLLPIIAAIGIAILINKFVFFNVYIPSESMVPTLNVGDKLVVTRIYDTDNIKRGDVVVFYSDELQETVIKRVIGIPGDHIEIDNGVVSVNGDVIQEDYVKNNEYNKTKLVFDVPEDKFFFLGDNRIRSNDARRWINPYIDASDIKGKAVLKFYPFSDFGLIK
ncbi:signal peptidase I [Clostridium sp. SM-530-WT-3G]|uniref:signal peptidase I n=1 Tax=Clostridium sp. SM-530-WT-3G TaxID=2725303 RepID=UPI00145EF8EF|nr:signal peptidase I [Clostridium sp. SM-530-WT-3G]NME83101.1 signal peptidase I [Clostridium sp. SM-530-WT-3G]